MEKDKINFLPWREAHLEQQRKKLSRMVMISSLIFTVFQCAIYINYRFELDTKSRQLEQLDLKKRVLQKEIKQQQQFQTEKAYLSENIKQLLQLRHNQGATTFLLSTLSSVVPTGLVLEEVDKRDEEVYLTGTSNSVRSVSRLMEELEKNIYFVNPEVKLISRSEIEPERHNFVLSFSLRLFTDSRDITVAIKGVVIKGKPE